MFILFNLMQIIVLIIMNFQLKSSLKLIDDEMILNAYKE
jgi:hypothetical protein